MYLAKLIMDSRHPSIRQTLKDRQDMHRNLARIFGREILYCVTNQRSIPGLLVLSRQTPDQRELESRGYRLIGIQDISSLPELYQENTVFRFEIQACPSKKSKDEKSRNSRRVFLTDPLQRVEWMSRQGQKYGFDVLELHEQSAQQTIIVGRGSGAFLLTAVTFSGVIRITEAKTFWTAWEKGIGPEKAYGMGLMLLARC